MQKTNSLVSFTLHSIWFFFLKFRVFSPPRVSVARLEPAIKKSQDFLFLNVLLPRGSSSLASSKRVLMLIALSVSFDKKSLASFTLKRKRLQQEVPILFWKGVLGYFKIPHENAIQESTVASLSSQAKSPGRQNPQK